MLTAYLQRLLSGALLTEEESEAALSLILKGADPHQVAAFFSILSYRRETPQEIAGMVRALKKKAVLVALPMPLLDIVGTGGDFAGTVNISTGSALLAAACGVPVARHGNRSVSSRCGSADVLEALGVGIEGSIEESVQNLNFAFLYAPRYHPSFKKVSEIRKGLKIPTIFNFLGPLLNPAKVEFALIGVAKPEMLETMSDAILLLGCPKRALVFHGNGLDEITTLGPIFGYEIRDGEKRRMEIDPASFGFSPCRLEDLQGGDAKHNAGLLKEVFSGKEGAIADALILNAGAALQIYGLVPTMEEGIQRARKILKEGKALALLEKLKRTS